LSFAALVDPEINVTVEGLENGERFKTLGGGDREAWDEV
jgi:hypothetical protein